VVLGLVGWFGVQLAQAVHTRVSGSKTLQPAVAQDPMPRSFDLQTASARALRRLPGIGEARALEIVRERWRLRGTGEPLDLASLPGIGATTAERVAAVLADAHGSPAP
jgi:DNA uptake protein ComE-like DNA-binding protein